MVKPELKLITIFRTQNITYAIRRPVLRAKKRAPHFIGHQVVNINPKQAYLWQV